MNLSTDSLAARVSLVLSLFLSVFLVACDGAGGGAVDMGTGGETGSGGASAGVGGRGSGGNGSGGNGSGGMSASTGGAPGGGGAGVGGAGTVGTGGRIGTGGALGTGGRAAGTGGMTVTGAGGSISGGGTTGTNGITCTPQVWDAAPSGWASQGSGTTGGGSATARTVTTLATLNAAAAGTAPAVIQVSGVISGSVRIGSNKTVLGLCGAEIDGSLDLSNSANVIVRNLKIVGRNCTDSPADCSSGSDAVHVEGAGAHNQWFDHLDISDGSDGNLDITNGADLVTVSWTKFHYSSRRTDPIAGATGHRFCNLIGAADTVTSDAGHLNVTFQHVWWADNVNQRMPRVRFGKVQVVNSLYTATGDSACIEVGVSCNIRSENNVFQGVSNAVDSTHSNAASIIGSIGNQGSATNIGGPVFVPPYTLTPDATATVAASTMAGAGPK
jgi:pectate lyase